MSIISMPKNHTFTPRLLAERRRRVQKIITRLKKLFPHASIVLKYFSTWELVVAVILSAQCTDKMENKVTATLFKKYQNLDDYVKASRHEFEEDIKSTGFYRNKAKHILAAAKVIKNKHHGKIPNTMAELVALPGIGRKTANVVLGNAYNVVEGIAVDTHVRRLTYRLGLTDYKDPQKIERGLMQMIPKKDWFKLTYLLIEYGRRFCPARKHNHAVCPLQRFDRKE